MVDPSTFGPTIMNCPMQCDCVAVSEILIQKFSENHLMALALATKVWISSLLNVTAWSTWKSDVAFNAYDADATIARISFSVMTSLES